MPTRVVQITAQSIGADSGPFTISDNVLGSLATNVPRTSILGGYNVNSDTTATQITITSTGPCTDTVTIPVDFVVCPTGPTPTVEWYQLQKCSDLTYTTSTSYNIGTFAVNDRVTDSNGVVYVVTQVYASDPGGAQVVITDTGFVNCPTGPPPEECRQNVVINVTNTGNIKYYNCTTNQTEYKFIGAIGNYTIAECVTPSSIIPGFPLANVAAFTIVNNGVPCGTPPPPEPQYYYYLGILCGGSIIEYFRSLDPALPDHAQVVKAWCATCGGGSEQCFDNISPSTVVNTNDVIATYDSCVLCSNATNYVTSVFGYMEPCIGGTIDDYQGAAVYVANNVAVDTTFNIEVSWTSLGASCSGSTTTSFYSVIIPAGQNYGSVNACQNGQYIPSGANVCSACISYCSDATIDLTGFTC